MAAKIWVGRSVGLFFSFLVFKIVKKYRKIEKTKKLQKIEKLTKSVEKNRIDKKINLGPNKKSLGRNKNRWVGRVTLNTDLFFGLINIFYSVLFSNGHRN